MANFIKSIVSNKRRYEVGGFNLDLSCKYYDLMSQPADPELILNLLYRFWRQNHRDGYPARHFEGLYRNHIDDVKKFFVEKHDNNYKIYNLCKEEKYQFLFISK
jgi:phosphatidylinositol-3,4,5-trisphosphate 3-phosphatase and dual-specificity protein phosphatase PTEN